MKKLIFVVLWSFLFSTYVCAQLIPGESPEFNYQIQTYPQIEKDKEVLLRSVDQYFSELEISPVLLPDGFSQTKSSLASMDRIYSGAEGNTVVFIKAGVIPSPELQINHAIKIDDGYLQHFKQDSGLVVAFYVKTSNWENASAIFTHFQSKFVSSSFNKLDKVSTVNLWSLLLLSSAHAEDNVNCDSKLKVVPGSLDKLLSTGEALLAKQSTPIQHIAGCTFNALKGVWNGSGGAVVEGAKGVTEFITSPVESGKRYWQSANKLWDVTKKFYNDFEAEARKLYPAFDSLDPLVKTKIGCQVVGTVGGGVLLSYLSAGVMTSTVMANVIQKIKLAISEAMGFAKFYKVRKELAAAANVIDKVDIDLNKNLFSIPRGTPEFSLASNKSVLENLKNIPVNPNPGKRKAGLSSKEIQQLFREVSDHPVASLSKVENYEKNSPGMGFCFGRATTAHIKALMAGADKSSIRKVWALGDLETGDTSWRYHVTTIIRDNKGAWHAIDPIMGRVMPVEQWYNQMKKFDTKSGNMRIFDTEPKRFGPDNPSKYSPKALKNKVYENYFTDLMGSFKEETSELIKMRTATP